MGINIQHDKAHCFKCLESKRTMELLMDMENFTSFAEARKFLAIQQEYEYFENQTQIKRDFKPMELPEGYHLITQGTSAWGKAARYYLKKRGFNISRLALKGVGYCTKGEYAGYIIFPFYRQGKLVYFQGRIYMGTGPKMKNPTEEQYGVGKSQLIYNQDALFMYNKIYWVESITNAETLGDQAVAGLGKSISNYQLSNLLFSPCSTVIILLDPDAWEEAVKLSMQLVHYKRVKLVKLPEGKDVNDLGKRKTLRHVKATEYQNYMALLKLKLGGKSTEHTRNRRGPSYVDRRGL
jgi:DNA primase